MVRLNDLFYKESKGLATKKAIEAISKHVGVKTIINENYKKEDGQRYTVTNNRGTVLFETSVERTIVHYLTLNLWNVAGGGSVATGEQLDKLGVKWNLIRATRPDRPKKTPAKKKPAKKKAAKRKTAKK